MSPAVVFSPAVMVALTAVWFAQTFARACSCPDPLDVRLERGRLECGKCGKCGKPIAPRVGP